MPKWRKAWFPDSRRHHPATLKQTVDSSQPLSDKNQRPFVSIILYYNESEPHMKSVREINNTDKPAYDRCSVASTDEGLGTFENERANP